MQAKKVGFEGRGLECGGVGLQDCFVQAGKISTGNGFLTEVMRGGFFLFRKYK